METVATDFSFSRLQRTPGAAPDSHIFGPALQSQRDGAEERLEEV